MPLRFPVLLLAYVALDFANPLMPGAVRFEAGSIEVVQGDRTTRASRPAMPPDRLVAANPGVPVVETDTMLTRRAASRTVVTLPMLWPTRRAPLPRGAAPPSPSEDH